jgi:hypothetical protein
MAYGEKYYFEFYNIENVQFRVSILQDGFSGSSTYLLPANQPFVLNYRDNQEELYIPIRGSEATIRFISTTSFYISEILSNNAFEFRIDVNVYNTTNSKLIWTGFIDSSSSSEELVDDPKVITIKATDGIAILKDIEFTNSSGQRPYEYYSVLQAISACLDKTGLQIKLNVEVNVFEKDMADRSADLKNEPLSQVYVHTRAFGKDDYHYDDCLSVMKSLLSAFNATIFQANGEWYIVRFPGKWENTYRYSTVYEYPYVNNATGYTQEQWLKSINQVDYIAVNKDHIRSFLGSAKCGQVTYNYQISDNIPRNRTFQHGDPLTGPEWNDTHKGFTIDFWRYEKGSWDAATTCSEILKRVEDYEVNGTYPLRITDNYMRLDRDDIGSWENQRAICDTIPMSTNDGLTISFSTKPLAPILDFNSSINVATLFLYGYDASVWTCDVSGYATDKAHGKWVQSTSGIKQIAYVPDTTSDFDDWRQVSFTTESLPIDGNVVLWLNQWNGNINGISEFKDLRFEFPQLGDITGEEAKMCQDINIRYIDKHEINAGNAISFAINGCFTVIEGALASWWHEYGVTEQKRLIEILARDFFRLRKRFKQKIEGTLKGVLSTYQTNYFVALSPLWQYNIINIDGIYLPTNLEIDFEADLARFYFLEFYDSTKDVASESGDSSSFKYLKP